MDQIAKKPPIILVANNPFGHHLLTSQLLYLYQDLDLDTEVTLLCNGVMKDTDSAEFPWLKVVSFATPGNRLLSCMNLVLKLIGVRFRHRQAGYHLRGSVAGALFFVSRLGALRAARYIYDPRGAYFLEWQEAGRPRTIGWLLRIVERRLVQRSTATIVTSDRFAALYEQLFGNDFQCVTIYNSTSFPYNGRKGSVPRKGCVRFVYLGTFNYWHDMDEVLRVVTTAAEHVGPDRVEISIYTLPKFHEAVKEKFSTINCAKLHVEYVKYDDIPQVLRDKHVGISVVRPTPSASIASPIKIADYAAFGLVPLMNSGIGDFDPHFESNESGVLYEFGEKIDLARLDRIETAPNVQIHALVSRTEACRRLAPVVELLRNG